MRVNTVKHTVKTHKNLPAWVKEAFFCALPSETNNPNYIKRAESILNNPDLLPVWKGLEKYRRTKSEKNLLGTSFLVTLMFHLRYGGERYFPDIISRRKRLKETLDSLTKLLKTIKKQKSIIDYAEFNLSKELTSKIKSVADEVEIQLKSLPKNTSSFIDKCATKRASKNVERSDFIIKLSCFCRKAFGKCLYNIVAMTTNALFKNKGHDGDADYKEVDADLVRKIVKPHI